MARARTVRAPTPGVSNNSGKSVGPRSHGVDGKLTGGGLGDIEGGLAEVRAAIAIRPQWRELLERLPVAVAPAAPVVLERLKTDQP